MFRRKFLVLSAAAIVAPALAQANAMEEQILQLLKDQGYAAISTSRTFLGRRRIVATSEEFRREIILNPRTGEILRDFWEEYDEDGSSASGLFDDDEFDEEDDDENDDNDDGDDSDDDDSDESDDDSDDDDEEDDPDS